MVATSHSFFFFVFWCKLINLPQFFLTIIWNTFCLSQFLWVCILCFVSYCLVFTWAISVPPHISVFPFFKFHSCVFIYMCEIKKCQIKKTPSQFTIWHRLSRRRCYSVIVRPVELFHWHFWLHRTMQIFFFFFPFMSLNLFSCSWEEPSPISDQNAQSELRWVQRKQWLLYSLSL